MRIPGFFIRKIQPGFVYMLVVFLYIGAAAPSISKRYSFPFGYSDKDNRDYRYDRLVNSERVPYYAVSENDREYENFQRVDDKTAQYVDDERRRKNDRSRALATTTGFFYLKQKSHSAKTIECAF